MIFQRYLSPPFTTLIPPMAPIGTIYTHQGHTGGNKVCIYHRKACVERPRLMCLTLLIRSDLLPALQASISHSKSPRPRSTTEPPNFLPNFLLAEFLPLREQMAFCSWSQPRSQNTVSSHSQKCIADGTAIVNRAMFTAVSLKCFQSLRLHQILAFLEKTLMRQH